MDKVLCDVQCNVFFFIELRLDDSALDSHNLRACGRWREVRPLMTHHPYGARLNFPFTLPLIYYFYMFK